MQESLQSVSGSDSPAEHIASAGWGDGLRVLIVHRYYYPDTPPVASLLRGIAERWSDAGHDVEVFTSQPCCKPNVKIPQQPSRETLAGVDVHRCWLPLASSRQPVIRVFNFLAFLFAAFWKIVLHRKKYDVVMCLTFPPVVGGVVVSTAAALRGSQFIYNMLDIHPESSGHAGKINASGILSRIALSLDRRSCDRAKRVVVLSDDMAQTYLDRYPVHLHAAKREKLRVIADFNPVSYEADDEPLPPEFENPSGKFRILFAGNVGEFQAIENLIQTAHLLAGHSEIEFLFVGDGSQKKKAIQQAGELVGKTVHFHGHQSVAMADKIIRTADLCIVSLVPGLYRVAFPCKTSSYLGAGRPVLMVLEEQSQLYRMTLENNLGYACRGEDPEALKKTILAAFANRDQLHTMHGPARAFAEEHLVPSAVLVKWENLLTELTDRDNATPTNPARAAG